jgi:PHD/YefM family antitoxin component YafN of YafNO toxin-antitoxin module
MLTISSSELQKRLGFYQDKALLEPIAVTRNGRVRLILLSANEYHRLKKLDSEGGIEHFDAELIPDKT